MLLDLNGADIVLLLMETVTFYSPWRNDPDGQCLTCTRVHVETDLFFFAGLIQFSTTVEGMC